MSYTLTLIDTDGATKEFREGRLDDVNFAREHTAMGDWSVTLPYDPSVEDWILSEIELERNGSLLFCGYLESITLNEERGTTRLKGLGIARDLTNGETTERYTSISAHEAIANYWSTNTSFDATVVDPSPNTIVSDRTVQDAPASDDFGAISAWGDDIPLLIENDRIKVAQTCWWQEGEAANGLQQGSYSGSEYSDGEAAGLITSAVDAFRKFTPKYKIPANTLQIGVRIDARDGHNGFEILVNGDQVDSVPADALSNDLSYFSSRDFSDSLDANTQHQFEVNCLNSTGSDDLIIDGFAAYDTRFSYNFDNSTDSDGYLAGPELYPDETVALFQEESTPWNIIDASITTKLADSDETPVRLQARLSSQTWFPNDGTEEDTLSITTDFGDEAGTNIQGRVAIGRRDVTRSTATPTEGFEGQKLTSWELSYSGNDIAIIEDQTLEGTHLANLQRLHEFAGMRFSVEHTSDSKPVESFRAGDVEKTLGDIVIRNRIRKIDAEQYANEVTVRGKLDDNGNRPVRTASDSDAIANRGPEHVDIKDPSLTTQADVDSAARQELGSRLNALDRRGELVIVAETQQPGYVYEVEWADGSASKVPLETLKYLEQQGEARGRLTFDLNADLAGEISSIRREQRRTKDAL